MLRLSRGGLRLEGTTYDSIGITILLHIADCWSIPLLWRGAVFGGVASSETQSIASLQKARQLPRPIGERVWGEGEFHYKIHIHLYFRIFVRQLTYPIFRKLNDNRENSSIN